MSAMISLLFEIVRRMIVIERSNHRMDGEETEPAECFWCQPDRRGLRINSGGIQHTMPMKRERGAESDRSGLRSTRTSDGLRLPGRSGWRCRPVATAVSAMLSEAGRNPAFVPVTLF